MKEHKQKIETENEIIEQFKFDEFVFVEFQIKNVSYYDHLLNNIYNYILRYEIEFTINNRFSIYSYRNFDKDSTYTCSITFFHNFIYFYKKKLKKYLNSDFHFERNIIKKFNTEDYDNKFDIVKFDIFYITNCINSKKDIEYFLKIYLMRIGKAYDKNKIYFILNLKFGNADNKFRWDKLKIVHKLFLEKDIREYCDCFFLSAFRTCLNQYEREKNFKHDLLLIKYIKSTNTFTKFLQFFPLKNKEIVQTHCYSGEAMTIGLHINFQLDFEQKLDFIENIPSLFNSKVIEIIIVSHLFELKYNFVFYNHINNNNHLGFTNSFQLHVFKKTKTYGLDGLTISEPYLVSSFTLDETKITLYNQFYYFNEFYKYFFDIKSVFYTELYNL
ncbi:hypothetical protein GVAV_001789 [Gurleya vavrai]